MFLTEEKWHVRRDVGGRFSQQDELDVFGTPFDVSGRWAQSRSGLCGETVNAALLSGGNKVVQLSSSNVMYAQ